MKRAEAGKQQEPEAPAGKEAAHREVAERMPLPLEQLAQRVGAAIDVILYRLFKRVHATLALLALVPSICDVAIEALLLTSLYVPLIMIEESAMVATSRHLLESA